MKGLKKAVIKSLSVMLAVVLTLTAAPLCGFVGLELPDWLDFSIKTKASTTSNGEAVSETEIINIDVYKAQCLAGIAQDSKSDAVEQCNDIYNYYINEELFSPTQTFLDAVYENESLVADYNEWMAYSLAAEPSSALDLVASKESYYESCVIAMYSEATVKNDAFIKLIENNALNSSVALIETMCELKGITETAQIIETVDITNPKTITDIQECVNATYSLSTATDVCSVVGTVLDYSTDIFDVMDRLAVYGEMVKLDKSTKLWISQMYDACDGAYDLSFKSALYDLKTASTDYAGAILVDIKTTGFTLAKWGISATIETGMEMFAALNPMTAAVCAGLKLGKTVNNLFFATDDVCEQLFVMNCIYDIQDLSRGVAEDCKNIFVAEQTTENAMAFTYSVDCYFESIINTDVDCMLSLLDTLYNGGWLKGLLTWMYGATNDYQEAVNTMESLREVRQNNYDLMINCFKAALRVNFPDIFDYYFEVDNTVPITDISFYIGRILPSGYPAGYADLIVGDFANIGVQYAPSNTTQKAYTVTSDNPAVIEVNDNIVTAVSAGTANVTITSVENPRVSYSEEITVGEKLEGVENEVISTVFTYNVNTNGEASITGFVDGYNPVSVRIPSKIEGHSVTTIGKYAFRNCTSLTSVTIGNSVTTIGREAFRNCTSLTSITIPDSVTTIGEYVFENCSSLTSVTIPDSVTTIGRGAFYYCTSLTSITIPDSVTTIGEYVFENCSSLTSVTIPDSVTTIGSEAFRNCTSLTSITIPDSVTEIGHSAFSNTAYYNDTNNWENGVLYIGNHLISVNYFLSGKYEMKDGTVTIGDEAFWGCINLTSITISDSVTTIGAYAFGDCLKLTSITIPDSVTTIGGSAFHSCGSLTDVYYTGTEEQWNKISIGSYNEDLTNATIHYNGEIVSDEGIVVIPENDNVLPADTNLNVNLLETTNVSITYDITLTSNGIEIQPNGTVTVKLPVPEGIDGNLVSVYRCETDGTYTNMGAVYENGYMIFITDHFSKYMMTLEDPTTPDVPDEPEYNYTFSILSPSRTEIRNKDGIILHANVEGNAPAGSYVRWESSNGNFDEDSDGSNLKIIAKNKGYTTFTAILCDADGNELARDSVEMYSKSGFFDKIGGFFRSLFGSTKIYDN